ncbi:MAG: hypothetical protein JNM80_05005 [Phycisphaerae bacterium]|nr:hypothetical protein [Phycisphaerae bacterium]
MPTPNPERSTPYSLDAGTSAPAPVATRPCAGCGHPVETSAKVCVRCGHIAETGGQARTKQGVERLPPPPPRFQVHARNPDAGLRPYRKPMVLMLVLLGSTALWKYGMHGGDEAAGYLVRYGITLAVAILVFAVAALTFVDYSGPLVVTALSIAAALAGADLVQHALHYTLIPTLAWTAAFVTYCGCVSSSLELDMPDAVFVGLGTYLAKLILKWTLFVEMFPQPSA